MIVSKENIFDFIPHRPPFLMIDGLVSATRERFESEFLIDENNVLVEDGVFQEGGLMENIAQTCAAAFGFLDKAEGGEPKIGFIGAISRVNVHLLPPHSSCISTIVTPTHQLGNIFMVTGQNFLDGKLLLECEMKIVTT
jgi:predicted hotdog family 3-hydroxylacyl-ACP dehydratase